MDSLHPSRLYLAASNEAQILYGWIRLELIFLKNRFWGCALCRARQSLFFFFFLVINVPDTILFSSMPPRVYSFSLTLVISWSQNACSKSNLYLPSRSEQKQGRKAESGSICVWKVEVHIKFRYIEQECQNSLADFCLLLIKQNWVMWSSLAARKSGQMSALARRITRWGSTGILSGRKG